MEAILAVTVIQAIAVLAALWLSSRQRLLEQGLNYLVSLAVGVLLSTALLHILPEALQALGNRRGVWLLVLATLFALFCIERIFAVVTGHPVETPANSPAEDCGPHHHGSPPTRPLNLIFGGMLHSFVDGVSVAAAFGAGPRIGWLTAAAITLHEIPHRMGDYALLRHLQVARRRAIELIMLIGVAALAGVLLVVIAGHTLAATAWLLPISAASFLYIAMVNLMPELASERSLRSVCLQLLAMLAGAVLVGLVVRLPGA